MRTTDSRRKELLRVAAEHTLARTLAGTGTLEEIARNQGVDADPLESWWPGMPTCLRWFDPKIATSSRTGSACKSDAIDELERSVDAMIRT